MSNQTVKITIYRWAGAWGPFKVSIPCGECALTVDIVNDTVAKDLDGIPVEIEIRDWLTEWYKTPLKGGWHAPIVMVDGKIIAQGSALNRGLLTEAVIASYCKKSEISGTQVFGKVNCKYCTEAKGLLDKTGADYAYHDVVASPRALYEMIARAKKAADFSKTPITTPQIWIDGNYIGGADQLTKKLAQ